MTRTPPPVINGARVLAYARLDGGRLPAVADMVFIANKPLGRVSNLVVTETPGILGGKSSGVLLLYCNQRWSPRGAAGYKSVTLAKRRAERLFPGSSARWVTSKVTKARAERYLKKLWAGHECSFCGRGPDQVHQLVASKRARICDLCIIECSSIVSLSKRAGA